MTASELIEKLKEMPPHHEIEVRISNERTSLAPVDFVRLGVGARVEIGGVGTF